MTKISNDNMIGNKGGGEGGVDSKAGKRNERVTLVAAKETIIVAAKKKT